MSEYSFTSLAQLDLEDIYDQISANNETAALKVIDAIEKRCTLLAAMPKSGKDRNELHLGDTCISLQKRYWALLFGCRAPNRTLELEPSIENECIANSIVIQTVVQQYESLIIMPTTIAGCALHGAASKHKF